MFWIPGLDLFLEVIQGFFTSIYGVGLMVMFDLNFLFPGGGLVAVA